MSGGYGWLARKFGLSVENLLEMTMVLADGSVVTVNEESHEELFWACKGNYHFVSWMNCFVHNYRCTV